MKCISYEDQLLVDRMAKVAGLRLIFMPRTRRIDYRWLLVKERDDGTRTHYSSECFALTRLLNSFFYMKRFMPEPGCPDTAYFIDAVPNPFYKLSREEAVIKCDLSLA